METLSKNSGFTATQHRIGGQKRLRNFGSFYQTVWAEAEGRTSPRDFQTMASSRKLGNASPIRERPSLLFKNSIQEGPSIFNATSMMNLHLGREQFSPR